MFAVIVFVALPGFRQHAASPEYQVKAVFLFNFTQFVDWPPAAFGDAQDPLVIGILGDDPFGPYLDAAVKGEVVKGHTLTVKRFGSQDEIKSCHILFISLTKDDKIQHILATLNGKSILTVGESADFAKRGGMVRFTTEDKKIRIHINLEAARRAELSISSKLLRLAQVDDANPNGG